MKLFICSDIHSCYDELMYSLKESGYNKNNPNHKLIILGDYFDNGNQACEMKKFLLETNAILIRGNHDDSLMRIYKTGYIKRHDFVDGTFNTMQQLGDCYSDKTETVLAAFRKSNEDLMKFYDKMPYYYIIGDVLFVHSWLPVCDDFSEASLEEWHRATLTSLTRQIASVKNGLPINTYPYTNIKKIVFGHHKADDLKNMENYEGEGVHNDLIRMLKTDKVTLYAIDGRVQLTGKIPLLIMEV